MNDFVNFLHRCADAKYEMCRAMGVSEAIIDNVLFCHQEEASWPLGTDKELKEKFDDIFGTTEYNDSVEKIRKKRKKYDDLCKNKGMIQIWLYKKVVLVFISYCISCTAIDLKELEMRKNETEVKMTELANIREDFADQEQNYQRMQNQRAPIRARLESLSELIQQHTDLLTDRKELETKYV